MAGAEIVGVVVVAGVEVVGVVLVAGAEAVAVDPVDDCPETAVGVVLVLGAVLVEDPDVVEVAGLVIADV